MNTKKESKKQRTLPLQMRLEISNVITTNLLNRIYQQDNEIKEITFIVIHFAKQNFNINNILKDGKMEKKMGYLENILYPNIYGMLSISFLCFKKKPIETSSGDV